ncbi:MAG: phosphonate ABC transporter permease, partial [Myxococcota bacterium]
AGGLGQEIELSIRYYQFDKLATALLAVLALMILIEALSARLRRLPTWTSVALLSALSGAGMLYLGVPWSEVLSAESLAQGGRFVAGFARPTADRAFLWQAAQLAVVTVAMAWVATIMAAVVASALAPWAAHALSVGSYLADPPGRGGLGAPIAWLVMLSCRLLLQLCRALPELVWALLFVLWLGPGATAGALAVAVHTIGILGRL